MNVRHYFAILTKNWFFQMASMMPTVQIVIIEIILLLHVTESVRLFVIQMDVRLVETSRSQIPINHNVSLQYVDTAKLLIGMELVKFVTIT